MRLHWAGSIVEVLLARSIYLHSVKIELWASAAKKRENDARAFLWIKIPTLLDSNFPHEMKPSHVTRDLLALHNCNSVETLKQLVLLGNRLASCFLIDIYNTSLGSDSSLDIDQEIISIAWAVKGDYWPEKSTIHNILTSSYSFSYASDNPVINNVGSLYKYLGDNYFDGDPYDEHHQEKIYQAEMDRLESEHYTKLEEEYRNSQND